MRSTFLSEAEPAASRSSKLSNRSAPAGLIIRGMRGTFLFALVGFLIACGDDGGMRDATDSGPVATIRVEPPDLEVTITDGAAVMQPYTATLVEADGTESDVTTTAVFSFADTTFGSFATATATVTGFGAGPTRVQATVDGVSGDTGLTVYVRQTVVDPGVDPTVPDRFESATEDPTLAPTIRYPLDSILVPPNLGQFDVHWSNPVAAPVPPDVFRVRMQNEFVDIKRYTNGLQPSNPTPFWMVFEPNQWYPIASSRQQLTLEVAGMVLADGTRKGTAAAQQVDVTNENARGGIYYWATAQPPGIFRYDVGTPEIAPSRYFPAGQEPGSPNNCLGCHTLSRDGSRMALTIDGGDGRGTVIQVNDRAVLVPFDGVSQPPIAWNFATFTPTADKVLGVKYGQMTLYNAMGGAVLATIPNTAETMYATHPELSPDGTRLVNVESSSLNTDYTPESGRLVIRSFDAATNTFGTPTVLVEAGTDGLQNYYPSFSPDSQWLIFTRTPSYGYNNANATTWITKADGSGPLIQLVTSDLAQGMTNSWARWVPFGQTFGPDNEPLFYVTWSSTREFGVRITPNGFLPQIWMTPVFTARAEAGMDPSGPAFRVPFQDVQTGNHIAQWTEQVVVVE